MSEQKLVPDKEIDVEIRKGSLPLNCLEDIERKFFDLVAEGKVGEVQKYLSENKQLNINSVDYQGLTALHIAVKKEDEAMVKLLISRPDINLKDVVLHAVATGNITVTEIVLDALNVQSPGSEYLSYEDSPEYDSDITPLILAAQCGDFPIIRLLLQRGHKIERPHVPSCLCQKCKSIMSESGSSFTRIRMNCYKAISNPSYITQATTDPVLYAFRLDSELKTAAIVDKEFRAEYLDLAQELRQFVVDLISECRNPAEIEMILTQHSGYKGSQDISFPRLQVAVDLNQKEFVGHSMVQQVLSTFWLGEYTSWNRLSILHRCFRVFARILMLPVIAISVIFAPNTRFSRKYEAPVNKYISCLASYLTFVLLIYLLSYFDGSRHTAGSPHTGLEPVIVVFVLGFIWSTIKQVWIEGRYRFFGVAWHWYDMITEGLFMIVFILWWKSSADAIAKSESQKKILERKFWPGSEPTLLHEGLFAIACILSFGRFAYFCLQSSRLGPLQISMGKMALQISYFLIFCFLLITSFAIPMTKLYVYYAGMSQTNEKGMSRSQMSSFTSFLNSFETLFWAMFCMSPVESVDVVIENIGGSKANPKLNYHRFTEAIGRTLFALYEILMVIAMINTLIAILSNTFQRVVRLFYIEYEKPPSDDEIAYENLMASLAQRYFRAKEQEKN